MIPNNIEFHGGVTFHPEQFIKPRRITGPIPADWARVRFLGPSHQLTNLNRWLADNTIGRHATYTVGNGTVSYIVVAFERLQDGVMFRLKGGETAFLTDT